MNVDLLNLERQYELIRDDLESKVLELFKRGQYILGTSVKEFEEKIADYLGVSQAVSVANGTDALIIALEASGIGRGDEVITTPFTYFASAESIARIGAIPVFVDVDSESFNIDVEMIEKRISTKTKGILPVHLFGQPANLDAISKISEKYGLKIIEDACQAIGAEYKGQKIGGRGDAVCFSFFPTKNLGCFGDGGLITTNSRDVADLARAYRVHGGGRAGYAAYKKECFSMGTDLFEEKFGLNVCLKDEVYENASKYYNYFVGYNSRLDEIQALILSEKLNHLDLWNGQRIKTAEYYNECLQGIPVDLPIVGADCKSVYHQYIIRTSQKAELIRYLGEKGISTGNYYPIPLHLQIAFRYLGYKEGDFPVSEQLSKTSLALPIYPELREDEKEYVVDCIKEFYR